MGINIGATMAPVVMEQMHRRFGWHAAFGTAGVGMGIGLAIFIGFGRYFAGADQPSERSAPEPADQGVKPEVERDRILALLIIFGIVVLFWMAYMQDFFTLTLWARDATRTRHAPE